MRVAQSNKTNQTRPYDQVTQSDILSSAANFTKVMFIANARNLQGLILSLMTPLGILAMMYWAGGNEISPSVVPLIYILSIIFSGSTLGIRIVFWREQKVFRRLAVTSTPMPYLLIGLFIAQLAISIAQALILLLILNLLGVSFTLAQQSTYILTIFLSCFCFTSLGPLLATLIGRAEILNYIYVLVIMPLSFVSYFAQFSPFSSRIAQTIVDLLPSTMLLKLLNVIVDSVGINTLIFNSIGLALYGALFLFISSRRVRLLL